MRGGGGGGGGGGGRLLMNTAKTMDRCIWLL